MEHIRNIEIHNISVIVVRFEVMRESRFPFFLALISIFTIGFVGSCSKAKVIGGNENEHESSGSSHIRALEADGKWLEDSIRVGDTLYFVAKVDSGKSYSLFWDDTFGGSGFYDADIGVLAKDSADSSEYWLGFKDLGYQGRTFRTRGPTLLVEVISLEEESTDKPFHTFAIQLNAISDLSFHESGSSSQIMSSFSTNPSAGSSPTSSNGSSSSNAVSSSSSSSASSDSWGNGGRMDPSSAWKLVHLKIGDTLTFVAPVTIGASYSLQWMDGYDYINSEIQNDEYPTADVEVSLHVGGKALFTNKGDGATPYVFSPDSDRVVIRVQPNYSKLDTGFFYIRLFGAESKSRKLEISPKWYKDSISRVNDTIQFEIQGEPGQLYRFDFIDKYLMSNFATGAIKWSYRIPDDPSLTFAMGAMNHILVSAGNANKISLLVSASAVGSFHVRVQKAGPSYSRVIPVDSLWYPEYLGSSDTLYFKVPTSSSSYYRIQLDNLYGSGYFNCAAGFSYRTSSQGEWRYDYIGNATNYRTILSSYYDRIMVEAESDTLYVRLIGNGTNVSNYPTLAIRMTQVEPMKHVSLAVSKELETYYHYFGDTTIFHLGVDKGQQYQIQWDDASQGSGQYNSDIKVWIKDGEASPWIGFLQNGYTSMNKLAASSDSIFVKVTGTSGNYRFGVHEYHPQSLTLTVDNPWQKDSILQQDTIWYTVKNLTPGDTYRLHFKDAYDSTKLANIVARVYESNGSTPYVHTWGEYGYTLNTFVPTETEVKIRVTGSTNAMAGSIWMRVEHRVTRAPEIQVVSPSWITASLATYDTLAYNFPVKVGGQYRIQINPSYSGIYISTAGGAFTTEALNADLVAIATSDTLKIKVVNMYSYKSVNAQFRVFELVPVDLVWSPSFAIWDDSHVLQTNDIISFRISGLTVGQYYILSWDDAVNGSGQYTASTRVSVRRASTGTLIMSPVAGGFVTARTIYAYEPEMFVYVSAITISGTFAISIRPN